jgi:hypothetical protein
VVGLLLDVSAVGVNVGHFGVSVTRQLRDKDDMVRMYRMTRVCSGEKVAILDEKFGRKMLSPTSFHFDSSAI